jgi:hypothetical protein
VEKDEVMIYGQGLRAQLQIEKEIPPAGNKQKRLPIIVAL